MNTTLKNQIQKTFVSVLSDFKNQNELQEFLNDFLTPKEFAGLAKRFSIAYWLSKKRSYTNIQNNLKVSSSTISEIATISKKPGFKLALKKLEADEWANQWSEKIKKLVKK